jgi:hypothetical protein
MNKLLILILILIITNNILLIINHIRLTPTTDYTIDDLNGKVTNHTFQIKDKNTE